MMRRMKFRAKPNFGIGGGGSRSSAAKPVSEGSAACSETQNFTSPKDEEAAAQPLASNSDKSTDGDIEVIPGTETESKSVDALGAELQEERNQPCASASLSCSVANTFPPSSPTALQYTESDKVADATEEHQQTVAGSDSAVSLASESNVSSQSTESNASPVPSLQAQQTPQERSDTTEPQITSKSTPHTPEVTLDKSPETASISADVPAVDKSNEASKETQQDTDAKSTGCMRRKKLKVKPMLGGPRKGGVVDKPKMKVPDQSNTESGVKNVCVKETIPDNITITKSETVEREFLKEKTISEGIDKVAGYPGNSENRFINIEAPGKEDTDISILPTGLINNQSEELLDPDKKADKTPESSELYKVCPAEDDTPQLREATNEESTTPPTELSNMAEVDTTDTPMIVNQKPKPVGEPKPPHTSHDNSTSGVGSKRRARIRAMPTIVTKKKKEELREATDEERTTPQTEVSDMAEVDTTDTPMIVNQKPRPVGEPNPTHTSLDSIAPTSELSKLVTVDTTDTPVIVNQKPKPVGEPKSPHTSHDNSASGVGSKRRARIRAMPTIVTKKKKEGDKIPSAKPLKAISVEVQPPGAASPLEQASNEEPSTALAELDAESNTDNQTEQLKARTDFGASKKEVSFAKTEVVDKKPTHPVNIRDNKKENKEKEQTKKIRKEVDITCKENTESPLQSNVKPCRKKKLSENNGADPELEVVNVVDSSAEKQGKKKLQKKDSEDIGNSDDSTGDKENASSAITELSSQEKTVRENKPLITQKSKIQTSSSEYSPKELFGRLEKKIKIEDSTERAAKQVFRKRKDEFRKKLSKGDLEPGKITMFDLIYWNPASNPMPGRTSSPKRSARSSGRSDTDSITSEAAEEQRVDDLGLDPTDSEHQSRPVSPEVVEVQKTQEEPSEENKDNVEEVEDLEKDPANNDEDSSAEKDVFAPRVKIGPNGEIMVDEQSIKIQTTAAKNRDEVLKKAVVVEESGDSSHYGKWSKRRRRSCEWTVKETALFYKALSTVGTDFSLMETLIKWRTRAELKTKFKKEERHHRELVDMALNDSTQFDMTLFEEEPDYDPTEDRKAARQAERAEAKRRRLELKQQDKMKEMERKKVESKKNKAETMNRKKLLRKACRNRAKKRKETFESDNEDSPGLYDSDNNASEDSVPDDPEPCLKIGVKQRPVRRRRQPKRRNSLVISEVTVTMETVKYDKPAEQNFIPEQTIPEPEASPECNPLSLEEEPAEGGDHRPLEDLQQSRLPECAIPEISEQQGSEVEHEVEDDITIFNEYSELPINDGLPDSYIIESMLSDNDETNPDVNQMEDLEDNVPNRNETRSGDEGECVGSSETTTELEHNTSAVEPVFEDDNQKMWHFPISAIQTLENGQQVITIPTPNGHYSVPVPVLPPGTSNVVVVATSLPDSPGEHIYHVYVVSPLDTVDS